MWDLPGPGIKPVSPALAGGFLTTAPPGNSTRKHVSGQCREDMVMKCAPVHWVYPGWGVSHLGPSPGLSIHHCVKILAENSASDLMNNYFMFIVRQHPVNLCSLHALAFLKVSILGTLCIICLFPLIHCLSWIIDCLIILSKLSPYKQRI